MFNSKKLFITINLHLFICSFWAQARINNQPRFKQLLRLIHNNAQTSMYGSAASIKVALPFASGNATIYELNPDLKTKWSRGQIGLRDLKLIKNCQFKTEIIPSRFHHYYRSQIGRIQRKAGISYLKFFAKPNHFFVELLVSGKIIKQHLPNFPGRKLLSNDKLVELQIQLIPKIINNKLTIHFKQVILENWNLTWLFNSTIGPRLNQTLQNHPISGAQDISIKFDEDLITVQSVNQE